MSNRFSYTSCLNDRPLTLREGDHLNNYRFAEGLMDFISQAATPITIAIQGGWGSGKTSLINLLGQGLAERIENGAKSLCVFVNAWEHSLFQAEAGQAVIAAGLMEGLIEEIAAAVEDCLDIPQGTKAAALGLDSPMGKAKKMATNLGKILLSAAAKQAIDFDFSGSGPGSHEPNFSGGAKIVRSLKESLHKAVSIIHDQTPYKRFVCFVDDLDRVHPATAIEILDALKNIFDIEECVFILAIDYEVVVKGLEGKFGAKTEANEREFRQYFDKIIQIPFTMPVGSYTGRLKEFIIKSLEALGYNTGLFPTDILENMKSAAYWATGGVPRSVKRIINTLSLLVNIQRANDRADESEDNTDVDRENTESAVDFGYLEIQFIVICLHINFPEICRALMEKPDFTAWSFAERQKPWGLTEEHYEALKNDSATSSDWGEEWQLTVYCLCRKYAWYVGREKAVVNMLNSLRLALKRDQGDFSKQKEATLTADEGDRLSDVLDMMRVVSVEVGQNSNVEKGNTNQLQLRFWEAVSVGLLDKKGLKTRTPMGRQYMDVSLGRTGFWLSNAIFSRRREIGVRFFLVSRDVNQNEMMMERLLAHKEKIENNLGAALEWPQLGVGKQKRFIGISRLCDITSEQDFAEGVEWMVEWIAKFKEVFGPLVKTF